MDRRAFLQTAAASALTAWLPATWAAPQYERLLILVELKGGNDGLNTVIPYADAQYAALRPRIAIPRDQVLQLDPQTGLHPSLAPLMPLWQAGSLAVVQGVGYPQANLSHFRSIEIWDTASRSNQFLRDGWLTRTFTGAPAPRNFAADAVVVGSSELGPFVSGGGGGGTGAVRTISLSNTEQFLRQAKLAAPAGQAHNSALSHVLRVEQDILQAAAGLRAGHVFRTEFPATAFGNAVRTAAQVVASPSPVAALKLSLGSFDTHSGQLGTHARLLKDLADGLIALKSALTELNRWDDTLIATYAEFGRRPRENLSGGTDHGTANAHFVLGGRVKGGLLGARPGLDKLDGNGNLPFDVDFRDIYATVLERWWGVNSQSTLQGKFAPLAFL